LFGGPLEGRIDGVQKIPADERNRVVTTEDLYPLKLYAFQDDVCEVVVSRAGGHGSATWRSAWRRPFGLTIPRSPLL